MTPIGQIDIELKVPGKHNIVNAVNAAAVLFAMGRDLCDIKKGLENFEAVSHRGEVVTLDDGSVVIDDSYNANPDSMNAAVNMLSEYQLPKIFWSRATWENSAFRVRSSTELGEFVRRCGIENFFSIGNRMLDAVEGYGEGARHFETQEELLAALKERWSRVRMPCSLRPRIS